MYVKEICWLQISPSCYWQNYQLHSYNIYHIRNSTGHSRGNYSHTYLHFWSSKLLAVDKDSTFTGEVIQFINQDTNCLLKIISLSNHSSYLTGKGETWPLYATYAVNISASPALSDFSPFELVFVCKWLDLLNFAFSLLEQFTTCHKDCLKLLKDTVEI